MAHALLTYTLAPDYLPRREALRPQHLALAEAASARGALLLGGAVWEDGTPAEALLLFTETRAAEDFARADPYVTQGLVTHWRVREWATVAGAWAD